MKTLGVIANCDKPESKIVLATIAARARALGLKLVSCGNTAAHLPGCRTVHHSALKKHIDALLTLGGDGTLLHAVPLLGATSIPILGVNLGALGFLTSVTAEEVDTALERLKKSEFTISLRTAVNCSVRCGRKKAGRYRALNDIVVAWGRSTRIVTVDAAMNGEHIASYRCDGLVVSTPTGSTGHSLSAGGPIVHPEADVLMLNVICPHTLSTRPLMIPDNAKLTLTINYAAQPLLLSVDGQEEGELRQGDQLDIERCPVGVRVIHLPGYNYFSVLRQKLQWRGSSV